MVNFRYHNFINSEYDIINRIMKIIDEKGANLTIKIDNINYKVAYTYVFDKE